ncbi:MAG: hypothetical protein H0W86_04400 [Armatimonadetes bacterium]|nr:hypothetical protein [Armatimonadota bacterium]
MSGQQTGPIADLSYRNYDGPKGLSKARWWPIAKSGLKTSFKKKGFWVLAAVSLLPYVPVIFMLFASTLGGRAQSFLPPFAGLLAGLYGSGFWPFMLALLVGAGSIAADNRANALQVYLAKPITRRDYLIGKWFYIFAIVFAVYFAPLLLLTSFQALTLGMGEFFKSYPSMYPQLVLLSAIPAFVHASVLLGLSAWNRTPWLVGVIYAGIFIFANFLALIMRESIGSANDRATATIGSLSIEGAISGIGANILGAVPRSVLPGDSGGAMPYVFPLILILVVVSGVGLLLASVRIRAVEVVKG